MRITGINLPAWTGEGWFFNPFAWQFLFMIGAILAYAPPRMPRLRWPIDAARCLVLSAGLIVIWVIDTHPRILASMPASVIRFVITEDKTGLHPFRLLSILSLAWLTMRSVPRDAAWLRSRVAAPLVLLGQNSLPVFCSGIFFGFLARLGLEARRGCGDADRGEPVRCAGDGGGGRARRLVSRQGPGAGAHGSRLPCRRSRGLIPDRSICAVWSLRSCSASCSRSPQPSLAGTEATGAAAPRTSSSPPIRRWRNWPRPLPRAAPVDILAVGSATTVGSVTAAGLHSAAQGGAFPWHMVRALHAATTVGRLPPDGAGGRGMTAEDMLPLIEAALKQQHYPLVLWQTGTVEAVRGLQPDGMLDVLHTGAERVRDAGGDLVLIDPQFSRFLRANTDLDPYENVMQQVATMPGVVLFHRFDLMRTWANDGAHRSGAHAEG